MAFAFTNTRNRTYYLHKREGNNGAPLYYFSKTIGDGAMSAVPEGREVVESRTGMPVLKKKAQ